MEKWNFLAPGLKKLLIFQKELPTLQKSKFIMNRFFQNNFGQWFPSFL